MKVGDCVRVTSKHSKYYGLIGYIIQKDNVYDFVVAIDGENHWYDIKDLKFIE